MSREEADAEETKKKSDDTRLTLAIPESKEEAQDRYRVSDIRVMREIFFFLNKEEASH